MAVSAQTQLCAVIGDPVGHSLSPQIHNAAFRSCRVNFVYVAFHVKRGDAAGALRGVRSLGIRGLSVTIPHKLDVIPHLDKIEESAKNTGSVNTVVNDSGFLSGCSTDGPGALRALSESGVEAGGSRVLLIGSGGAARAIAFALGTVDPIPELQILGVEAGEREKLERDLRERTELAVSSGSLSEKTLEEAMAWAEVVVHATPVGMNPKAGQSLVPSDLIEPRHAVFDVVYNPLETRLLREAKVRGARTVPGLGMFVHQGAIQFELWTGLKPPLGVMYDTVKKALG